MRIIGTICVLLVILTSCSTTKSLQKDEMLYKGSRISVLKKEYSDDWKLNQGGDKLATVYLELWDAPNGALFGLPFTTFIPIRLYFYNAFYDTSSTGFNYWMRNNFGEPPLTIDLVNPALKVQKGISIYENYGHFGTTGSYKLRINKKKNKAFVRYTFVVPKAYTYKNVVFNAQGANQHYLQPIFNDYQKTKALLKPNTEFNLYTIRQEKINLWTHVQNNGFYYLRKNDVVLLADTSVGYKQVNIEVNIAPELPDIYYQPQTIGTISTYIDSTNKSESAEKYTYWESGRLKNYILDTLVLLSPGKKYSLANTQKTIRDLYELGIFENPHIIFSPNDADSSELQTNINLKPIDATRILFNIRGNYKSTGYLGPSIGVSLRQLNLFGGAENLTTSVDAYYDFPIGVFRDRVSVSSGFSIRNTLSSPLLHTPFNVLHKTYNLPKQFITLNFDFNHRVDYFDLYNWNAAYGWTWKTNPRIGHKLELINATFSNVRNTTPRFDEITATNPQLRESLVNQFLLGSSYEFSYQRPATRIKPWAFYYQGILDLSGNALNAASSVLSDKPIGEQEFLGVPFAQFTRLTSQFVANWHVSSRTQLVFRNITGIGLAYGNSSQMPYIRQYFIGGSNSLRPLNARTVGPGRFIQLDEAEVNQVGDFKIECNVEYRLPLFWKLELAVFTDLGNIWLLKPDPNRPLGEVRWNKLLEDSYMTSGLGLRFISDYITLRVDGGVILYAPIFIDDKRWIWQNKLPLYGLTFGIGYPF